MRFSPVRGVDLIPDTVCKSRWYRQILSRLCADLRENPTKQWASRDALIQSAGSISDSARYHSDANIALGPILKMYIPGQIRIFNALNSDGYSTGNAPPSGNNAWRHQAITWANVDLTSVRSSGIHLRTISPKMPKPPITEITFKNYLSKKFHSNLPRANELKHLYDPSEILDLYCTTSLYIPPSLISLTCGSSLHTSTGFLSRFLSVIRCTGNHIRWSSILIGYWISQWQPSVFHNSLRQSIVFNPHLFPAIWCHRRPHTLYRSLINHLLQPRLQLLQTAVCRLNNRHATVVAGAPMETQLEGGDDVMVVTVDGSVTSRRFVHHGMKVGELYEVPRLENTTRNSELSEEQIAVMV